jgi:nitrogen fixation protein NifX
MNGSYYIKRTLEVTTESASTPIRVAFASSDQHQVDQHFGSASRFAIYGLDEGQCELLQIAEFIPDQDGHQQMKIDQRLALLQGCIAVYCVAVGDSVVRQLWAHGIRPVKVDMGSDVTQLIKEFQSQWYVPSSPLRRQHERQQKLQARRANFSTMEEE